MVVFSVTQLCLTLCNPMECSVPDFHILRHLLELARTHVHWVGDSIQPSCLLLSPAPPAFNLSQHQGLSRWSFPGSLVTSGDQSNMPGASPLWAIWSENIFSRFIYWFYFHGSVMSFKSHKFLLWWNHFFFFFFLHACAFDVRRYCQTQNHPYVLWEFKCCSFLKALQVWRLFCLTLSLHAISHALKADETGAYYTEWSKPERKTPIQYTNAYIWNLERW